MAAEIYVLRAALAGFRGVSRKLALRGDETLADLHQLLQFAFEWDDDHLYAFWLTGAFWDRQVASYGRPEFEQEGQRSARARLDRLDLQVGQKLAYVFDFGEEWRVRLTVVEIRPASTATFPPILASCGDAPPQYGLDLDEWAESA